jgi:hypothetical protein
MYRQIMYRAFELKKTKKLLKALLIIFTLPNHDPNFSIQIRLLPALAFVPINDVEKAFEELLDSKYYKEHEDFLQSIVDYFEDIRQTNLKTGKKKFNIFNSDVELL